MPNFFKGAPAGEPTPGQVAQAIATGKVEGSEVDSDAVIRDVPEAEAVRGLKTGEVWDPEKDNAALTEAEAARRKKFWDQCVRVNLDIAEKHRVAIREAMARRKTGAWASFDGEDVVLDMLRVEGNTIIVTFEFFDGYQRVDEKISF